jgi:hypothetical protein
MRNVFSDFSRTRKAVQEIEDSIPMSLIEELESVWIASSGLFK